MLKKLQLLSKNCPKNGSFSASAISFSDANFPIERFSDDFCDNPKFRRDSYPQFPFATTPLMWGSGSPDVVVLSECQRAADCCWCGRCSRCCCCCSCCRCIIYWLSLRLLKLLKSPVPAVVTMLLLQMLMSSSLVPSMQRAGAGACWRARCWPINGDVDELLVALRDDVVCTVSPRCLTTTHDKTVTTGHNVTFNDLNWTDTVEFLTNWTACNHVDFTDAVRRCLL